MRQRYEPFDHSMNLIVASFQIFHEKLRPCQWRYPVFIIVEVGDRDYTNPVCADERHAIVCVKCLA